MKVAAIDLGTNTFLCLIAEVSEAPKSHAVPAPRTSPVKSLTVIEDVSRVVRLGEGVHQNRCFLPQALARAKTALSEFQQIIRHHKVEKIVATATSAARDVTNGEALLQLGRDHGIPITIIEGEREAQLSFEGAVSALVEESDLNSKNILVIDVGGGSTELIYSEAPSYSTSSMKTPVSSNYLVDLKSANSRRLKAQSFDVGCVRLTEMFLKKDPVDQGELQKLRDYATQIMGGYGEVKPDLVIAVAGTPTTLACVDQKIDFEEKKVEGFTLTLKKIDEMVRQLGALTLADRKKLKGLEPLRADVIVAGCVLLSCGLGVAGQQALRVSTRGLRYGAALNYTMFKS